MVLGSAGLFVIDSAINGCLGAPLSIACGQGAETTQAHRLAPQDLLLAAESRAFEEVRDVVPRLSPIGAPVEPPQQGVFSPWAVTLSSGPLRGLCDDCPLVFTEPLAVVAISIYDSRVYIHRKAASECRFSIAWAGSRVMIAASRCSATHPRKRLCKTTLFDTKVVRELLSISIRTPRRHH